jgi:histone-lysine N-methyltransferase SETMAR
MLSAGIVFLHDNARPHTVRWTASLLQEFSWEVFNHPSYSLDLAPSDFHLFLHLKKFHQRFENDREAEMVVTQWFKSQAADFYDTGIQKLVSRYDKCLNSGDEYVEK